MLQPELRRKGLLVVFTLALVPTAVMSVVLMGTGAAGAQDDGAGPPAEPSGLSVSIEAGSLDASVDWNDVEGPTPNWVRWRSLGDGGDLNDGVKVETSEATITVADYGTWVVRVQACNDSGSGEHAAQGFTVEAAPVPNRAPMMHEQADEYDGFTGSHNNPRDTLVFKTFAAISSGGEPYLRVAGKRLGGVLGR